MTVPYDTRTTTPQSDSKSTYEERLSGIVEKLHGHGNRCYCEDDEKGLNDTEAKKAITELFNDVIGEDVEETSWSKAAHNELRNELRKKLG